MRVLCTMPGRFGDILWALPTVRALSAAYGGPVDLWVSQKYGAIAPLLAEQPYIAEAATDASWQVEETAPITPRAPSVPAGYDAVYHLGYEAWPEGTLADDIYRRAKAQWWPAPTPIGFPPLDLDRPWVTTRTLPPPPLPMADRTQAAAWGIPQVVVGWSEEWLELKVGLLLMLAIRFPAVQFWWIRPWGGRYGEIDRGRVWPQNVGIARADWTLAPHFFVHADVFLGCLSSSWVLANALGVPTVIVEPAEARHHPVFWRASEKNRMVLGNDGQPTFDARHAGDVLQEVIHARVRV